jgi:hypothetical protein
MKIFPNFSIKISCSVYSSTLKMEVTFNLERPLDFQPTTWHFILGDRTLHNHRCENMKLYIISYS